MARLKKQGIENKLRILIAMTMNQSKASILTSKGETEDFIVNRGVRQGDGLSTTLFNLALEYVMRNVNKGNLITSGGQIVAYADGIVIITKRRKIMEQMLLEIQKVKRWD